MSNQPLLKVSIVTTLYKSEKFIPVFLNKVKEAVESLNISFELILVLDGITDNSLDILLERKEEFENIKIIELSRNFGHHYALMAGLSNAEGEYVMAIDCDLEVSPLIIQDFYNEIEKCQCDVVYGFQSLRKGKFFERISGSIFWSLFNFFSETKIQENVITERIMTKEYVSKLIELNDKNLFLAGMMSWVGYNQIGIEVKKDLREGKSSYTFIKKFNLMINAITSFSAYPLNVLFSFGIFITLVSFFVGFYYIIMKFIFPDMILSGFTSLITAVMFSTGIIVLSIGIVGKYIEKIFDQVKGRPLYIIRKITK